MNSGRTLKSGGTSLGSGNLTKGMGITRYNMLMQKYLLNSWIWVGMVRINKPYEPCRDKVCKADGTKDKLRFCELSYESKLACFQFLLLCLRKIYYYP
jgi:hypothetical protein